MADGPVCFTFFRVFGAETYEPQRDAPRLSLFFRGDRRTDSDNCSAASSPASLATSC
jgi:hypothetical protein